MLENDICLLPSRCVPLAPVALGSWARSTEGGGPRWAHGGHISTTPTEMWSNRVEIRIFWGALLAEDRPAFLSFQRCVHNSKLGSMCGDTETIKTWLLSYPDTVRLFPALSWYFPHSSSTSALEDAAVAVSLFASLFLMSWELHKGNKRTLQPISKALASGRMIPLTFSQVIFLFGRQQECHSRRMSQGCPGSASTCWRWL